MEPATDHLAHICDEKARTNRILERLCDEPEPPTPVKHGVGRFRRVAAEMASVALMICIAGLVWHLAH